MTLPSLVVKKFLVFKSIPICELVLVSLFTNGVSDPNCIDTKYLSALSLETVTVPILISFFLSRSEEHTSELQSRFDIVCRLLLEKKNKQICYVEHMMDSL